MPSVNILQLAGSLRGADESADEARYTARATARNVEAAYAADARSRPDVAKYRAEHASELAAKVAERAAELRAEDDAALAAVYEELALAEFLPGEYAAARSAAAPIPIGKTAEGRAQRIKDAEADRDAYQARVTAEHKARMDRERATTLARIARETRARAAEGN